MVLVRKIIIYFIENQLSLIMIGFLLFIRADLEKFPLEKNTKYSIIKDEKNLSNYEIGAVWNESF